MNQVLVAYAVPGVPSREKQFWLHVLDTFSLRKCSAMLSAVPSVFIESNNLSGVGSDFHSNKLLMEPSAQSANIINIPAESVMLEISNKSNDQVICRVYINKLSTFYILGSFDSTY